MVYRDRRGILAGLWIAVAVVSRAPILHKKLVETLSEKMDADVELANFSVKTFPRLRIPGDGLKLRLKGQTNPPPFIEIKHFEVSGGISDCCARSDSVGGARGLRITIPAAHEGRQGGRRQGGPTDEGPVLIDLMRRRTRS